VLARCLRVAPRTIVIPFFFPVSVLQAEGVWWTCLRYTGRGRGGGVGGRGRWKPRKGWGKGQLKKRRYTVKLQINTIHCRMCT